MRNLRKQIKDGTEKVSETLFNLLTNFKIPEFRNPSMKIALILVLFFVNISGTTPDLKSGVDSMNTAILSPEKIYVNSLQTKFSQKLVIEVDNYVKQMAPGSQLNPEHLVEKCLEYETDIIFVLAQALLESHFGTKGKAAETNSVWNVGTYDDGQILYRYRDPNESLEPYLRLINEKYLINVTSRGDTIYKNLGHLLQDRGYINYNGNRFASAKGYEDGMRKLMVKIDMETSISFYQNILKLSEPQILAYFAPPENLEFGHSKLQATNGVEY